MLFVIPLLRFVCTRDLSCMCVYLCDETSRAMTRQEGEVLACLCIEMQKENLGRRQKMLFAHEWVLMYVSVWGQRRKMFERKRKSE